jgi:cytochrome c peroxidase
MRSVTVIGVLGVAALLGACKSADEGDKVAAQLAASSTAQAGSGAGSGAAAAPVAQAATAREEFNPRLLRRFKPARKVIPGANGEPSEAQVALGRMLYHETRISGNQKLSCNSCHALDKYGVDSLKTSKGVDGQTGNRNAPSVFHAAAAFQQFWDGRAGTVEEQALGPILNPIEMAAPNGNYVVKVLDSMPEYREAFKRAFPGETSPVTMNNVGRAIGAFERLLTTRARWDDFLEGNQQALSAHEVEGLKAFTNIGCMVCHTGELLGGSMYEKVGAVEAWPNQNDQGRQQVTQASGDKMMFKVPTLRNVSETGPYFHDGSAATLEQAVSMMARYQLGLELQADEVAAIVSWLGSLRGELPKDLIQAPPLPPSTNATPGPGRGK